MRFFLVPLLAMMILGMENKPDKLNDTDNLNNSNNLNGSNNMNDSNNLNNPKNSGSNKKLLKETDLIEGGLDNCMENKNSDEHLLVNQQNDNGNKYDQTEEQKNHEEALKVAREQEQEQENFIYDRNNPIDIYNVSQNHEPNVKTFVSHVPDNDENIFFDKHNSPEINWRTLQGKWLVLEDNVDEYQVCIVWNKCQIGGYYFDILQSDDEKFFHIPASGYKLEVKKQNIKTLVWTHDAEPNSTWKFVGLGKWHKTSIPTFLFGNHMIAMAKNSWKNLQKNVKYGKFQKKDISSPCVKGKPVIFIKEIEVNLPVTLILKMIFWAVHLSIASAWHGGLQKFFDNSFTGIMGQSVPTICALKSFSTLLKKNDENAEQVEDPDTFANSMLKRLCSPEGVGILHSFGIHAHKFSTFLTNCSTDYGECLNETFPALIFHSIFTFCGIIANIVSTVFTVPETYGVIVIIIFIWFIAKPLYTYVRK